MSLPRFDPMPLAVLREPFDHADWLYELKFDGFRAIAYIEDGICRLVSRNGNVYRSFPTLAAQLAAAIPGPAVLDGEIVCLDAHGRPQFYELMRRRQPQYFAAFDVLYDGEDLRERTLVERKRLLRDLIPATGPALFVDHIAGEGVALYRSICEADLEGIVAKRADGRYTPEETSWVKVRNPKYSQWDGRRELFDRKRARRATA